jgi:hypothetical protein
VAATGLLGINPYQKGVALDISSKPINFAIQAEQRNESKREALDKYFMDYEKSLNPAGMRTQDQDAFLKKLAETKQYYLKNKDKILNPAKYGAEAQSQLMAGYKDVLSTIDKSKQRAAEDKVLAPFIIDARKNNRTIPQDVLDALERNKLSIADPNHVGFDPLSFDAYDKHDENKFKQAVYSNIKPSESEPKPIFDKIKNKIYYETINDINKNALGEIESSVGSELQKDRGLVDRITQIARNPNKLNELAQVYKDFSGKQMNPSSLQDVATAYAISLKPSAVSKYTNPEATEASKLANQKEIARYRKSLDGEEVPYNNLVGLVEESKKTPKVWYNKATGKNETAYVVPLTKSVQSEFTYPVKIDVKNTQGEVVGKKVVQREFDNILYNPNRKEFVGYYQNLDENGNPTNNFDYIVLNPRDVATNILKREVTGKELRGAVESSLKGLYGNAAQTKPVVAAPEGFTFKGKKYTTAQVEKAAKASGMSVDEYIKALK